MKFDDPITEIHEKFHPQPNFKFPSKKLGSGKNVCNRRCHSDWFEKWNWLHYSVTKDSLFCFVCNQAYVQNKLFTNNIDKKFIFGDGFSLWNKATGKDGKISKHEKSECHKEAMEKICSEIRPTENISSVLSNEYRKTEEQNRHCLIQIIDVVKLLVRQGLPLRGDDSEKDKKEKNVNSEGQTTKDSKKAKGSKVKKKACKESEKNSNFHQLMLLQAKNDPVLAEWMRKETNKYTSNTSQNEIIKILYMNIVSSIKKEIQKANFAAIMFDETRDISNIEQGTFCVRIVKENFETDEIFLGLYQCDRTTSEYILKAIKDILFRFEIGAIEKPFQKIRGQNYDGARSLSGIKSGVKVQILKEEKRALGVHCYAHSTSLAVCDSLKQCSSMRDALSYSIEIEKLIKLSPKRQKRLQQIKEETNDKTQGMIIQGQNSTKSLE